MSMDDSLRASGRLANSELRCKNSCGFYGNPMWDGYCSKCYKELKDHSPALKRHFPPDAFSESQQQQLASAQSATAAAPLLVSLTQPSPSTTPPATPPASSKQSRLADPRGSLASVGSAVGAAASPAQSPTLRSKFTSSVKASPTGPAKFVSKEKPKSSPRNSRKTTGASTAASKTVALPAASTSAAEGGSGPTLGGFGKFEEKKRAQQATKKGIRIFRKQAKGDAAESAVVPSETSAANDERQKAAMDLTELLKSMKKAVNQDVTQYAKRMVRRMLHDTQNMKAEEQANIVQELYQWFEERMQTQSIYRGVMPEQQKAIMDNLEKYLMASIYSSVWAARGTEDEEKDKDLSLRLRRLQWVTAAHLEIEPVVSSTKAMTWLQRAQQELLVMDTRRSPSEKLRHVTQCCMHIFNALTHASGGAPASADDFLPVLIYVVLQAAPPRLNSNVQYISRFSNQNNLLSGESGYHFTNLCCSVSFLENASPETLRVSQEEFDGWMVSKPVVGHGLDAPDSSVRQDSPAIESLHQCVRKLVQLNRQQERQMEECQQLKKEFALFRANLVGQVAEALKPAPTSGSASRAAPASNTPWTSADV